MSATHRCFKCKQFVVALNLLPSGLFVCGDCAVPDCDDPSATDYTRYCTICLAHDFTIGCGRGTYRGIQVQDIRLCKDCYIKQPFTIGGGSHGVSGKSGQSVHGNPAGTGSGGGAAVTSSIPPGSVNWVGTRAQNAAAIAARRYSGGAAILAGTTVSGSPPSSAGLGRSRSPHEGIRVGEITAYRCWKYDGVLRSATVDEIWAPGEAMTESKSLDAGDIGIHCYKLKRQAYKYPGVTDKAVYGSIAIWGEIREHELGYRAEYARIIGLDRPSWMSKDDYADLCDRYGVAQSGVVSRPPAAPPATVYITEVTEKDWDGDTWFSLSVAVGLVSFGGLCWAVVTGQGAGPSFLLGFVTALAFRIAYNFAPFKRGTS